MREPGPFISLLCSLRRGLRACRGSGLQVPSAGDPQGEAAPGAGHGHIHLEALPITHSSEVA